MKVSVIENVLKLNDEIAAMNRKVLKQAGIFVLDLIGAPGCGKTALCEATIQKLQPALRVPVIVGDLATQRDADRMARWCEQVVQINTGKGCHLEANHVHEALGRLDLSRIDVLFIENVGNLICPVGFDLGQDVKVGMFSVSEGDDKPAKHPYLVKEASVILLTKTDLLPHVPFNSEVFHADIRRLNDTAPVISISVTQNKGMDAWLAWLGQMRSTYTGAQGVACT